MSRCSSLTRFPFFANDRFFLSVFYWFSLGFSRFFAPRGVSSWTSSWSYVGARLERVLGGSEVAQQGDSLLRLNKEFPCWAPSWTSSWSYVEARLGRLLGAILGRFWRRLGDVLGVYWGFLGASWGVLAVSMGCLGASLGGPGGILGRLETFQDALA